MILESVSLTTQQRLTPSSCTGISEMSLHCREHIDSLVPGGGIVGDIFVLLLFFLSEFFKSSAFECVSVYNKKN